MAAARANAMAASHGASTGLGHCRMDGPRGSKERAVVEMVSIVEFPGVVPGVTEVGLKLHEVPMPAGLRLQLLGLNMTAALNPFCGVTVMVELAACPALPRRML